MKILTRAQGNISSYRSVFLAYEDAEPIQTEVQKLLLLFTHQTDGSTLDTTTFNGAIEELQGCFLSSADTPSQALRSGACIWAKTLVTDWPFAEASAGYLLAASVGPETERGDVCRILGPS